MKVARATSMIKRRKNKAINIGIEDQNIYLSHGIIKSDNFNHFVRKLSMFYIFLSVIHGDKYICDYQNGLLWYKKIQTNGIERWITIFHFPYDWLCFYRSAHHRNQSGCIEHAKIVLNLLLQYINHFVYQLRLVGHNNSRYSFHEGCNSNF